MTLEEFLTEEIPKVLAAGFAVYKYHNPAFVYREDYEIRLTRDKLVYSPLSAAVSLRKGEYVSIIATPVYSYGYLGLSNHDAFDLRDAANNARHPLRDRLSEALGINDQTPDRY